MAGTIRAGGDRIVRYQGVLLMCALIGTLAFSGRAATAAPPPPMTIHIQVSGDVHLDRLERYAADLHDTGCTLIRNYAPPGKPHAYLYTLTINEGGRHFRRDTLYLEVNPYRRGQTVYNGVHAGRVQWFTEQGGYSVVVTALPVAGVRFRVTLAADLRSGTVEATHIQASAGGQEGLTVSMSASWTCPVLFREHWG
jgi:hypothetical protein